MPVRWQETHLIVLESIIISPPYTTDTCRLDSSAEQTTATGKAKLDRVKKVLEGERMKILNAMPELNKGG